MTTHFRNYGASFLGFAILLLLVAGFYQRIVNPSLEYRLGVPVTGATASQDHDHPPLPEKDAEELGRAMAQLRDNPANPDLLIFIADIFSRNKDWLNAVGFLNRAAEIAPSDMRPHYYLGVALAGKGEHANAAAAFEKALHLAPDSAQSRFNLAILYRYYLNRQEKAVELLRAVANAEETDGALRRKAQEELASHP